MLPPLPKQRNLVEKPEKPDRVKSLALMVPEVAGSTTLSVNDPSECLDAEEVASTVAETSPGDSAEDIDRRHVHSAHATLSSRLPIKSSTPKTLSAPWFTRPDFFSAELSAVFYRGWTYACHLSLLYPQGVVAGNVPDGTFRQLLLGEMDYFVLRVDGEWKAFRGIAPSRQTGIERATPLRTDGGQALRDEDCGLLNQTQLKIAQGLPTMALHITIPSNLVFVSPHPSGSFTEYFGDFEETLRDYDFESCTLHATWRSVGKFNWKVGNLGPLFQNS